MFNLVQMNKRIILYVFLISSILFHIVKQNCFLLNYSPVHAKQRLTKIKISLGKAMPSKYSSFKYISGLINDRNLFYILMTTSIETRCDVILFHLKQ